MKVLYKNANIVTQNSKREIIENGFILAEEGKIVDLGKECPLEYKFDDVVDLEGKWLLPGFINSHVHLGESVYFPFIKEKLTLVGYLNRTEEIYASSFDIGNKRDVACIFSLFQLILNGVTTIGGGRVSETAKKLSIPNTSGYMFMDSAKLGHFSSNAFDSFLDLKESEVDSLTQHCVFIHSLSRIGVNELETVKRLRQQITDLIVMIHVAEDGGECEQVSKKWGASAIVTLKENGILSKNTFLVHGNHLSDFDLDIISDSGATICHCLTSNLTVADKVLDISKVLDRDINTVIATDGPITGAGFNLLNEARKVYQYQNRFLEKEKLAPQQCLDMITVNAASAINQSDLVGSIEVGKLANFVVLNPLFEIRSHQIVDSLFRYDFIDIYGVVINGTKAVWDKQILFSDWNKIQHEFSDLVKSIEK